MKIKVNGRDIVFYKSTLKDLLAQYRMDPTKIVVERNGEMVQRDTFDTLALQEGDVVEIARFVGGG
ncbi:MAG TPA: sulfur carrier protein ThiS [Spirochaetota bacterium]|nr:sulfur carrier protein ThiS [Spirochaetota bacterium]